MTNITTAQRELLGRAAIDTGRATDTKSKTAKALIKNGLAISQPAEVGPNRLLVTEAGRVALRESGEPRTPPEPVPPGPAAPSATGPKGKLGAMVALMRRPEGATVTAMMAATSWQAHSVRGAMSGSLKKKLGLTIASEKTSEGPIYRITQAETASDGTAGSLTPLSV